MKHRSLIAATVIVFTVVFVLLTVSGCTEYERRGYSSLPQNTPGSWESNPYSNIHN